MATYRDDFLCFSDCLAKSSHGEGSRGGTVIGHTRSGKPIYQLGYPGDHRTHGFDKQDHLDAAQAHAKRMSMHISLAHTHRQSRSATPDSGRNSWYAGLHEAAMEAHDRAADANDSLSALSKAEGSRGGHIIGHTRSGKPIYDHHSSGSSAHREYTAEDHSDASDAHQKEADRYAEIEDEIANEMTDAHGVVRGPIDERARQGAENAKDHHETLSRQHDLLARGLGGGLEKSAAGHGEGSRGGHIIGHSKSGHPIYAHYSVAAHETMPLLNGHQYTMQHLHPRALDLDDPGKISSDMVHEDQELPLANGHKIRFQVSIDRHGGESGDGWNEPIEAHDPEFDIRHKIVDANGRLVEGATLAPDLEHALSDHEDKLYESVVNEYNMGEGNHLPAGPNEEREDD